jgi:hypothetical protein
LHGNPGAISDIPEGHNAASNEVCKNAVLEGPEGNDERKLVHEDVSSRLSMHLAIKS